MLQLQRLHPLRQGGYYKGIKMCKDKIFLICKKNNIAEYKEFKAFYHQYKKYYSVIDLIKVYKNHIFIYGEFKY